MLQNSLRNRSAELPLVLKRVNNNTSNVDLSLRVKQLEETLSQTQAENQHLNMRNQRLERMLAHKAIHYEQSINDLKQELVAQRQTPHSFSLPNSLEIVNKVYSQVMQTLNDIRDDYKHDIQIQEKGLIRAFDNKLNQLCNNFEERRQRKIQEISDLVKEDNKKSKELDILKASAYAIQAKNTQLEQENKYLKQELQARDSEFSRLMTDFYKLKRKTNQPSPIKQFTIQQPTPLSVKRPFENNKVTERYETVISKLRTQLETERRNLRAARTAYSREVEAKTDLEALLRSCVEDARQELALKRGVRRGESEEDRRLIVDKLVATEEVLRLLYDKTFPLSDKI